MSRIVISLHITTMEPVNAMALYCYVILITQFRRQSLIYSKKTFFSICRHAPKTIAVVMMDCLTAACQETKLSPAVKPDRDQSAS